MRQTTKNILRFNRFRSINSKTMSFAIGAANAPSLGGWIIPGLTPRMTDQGPAPYAVINARNNSATPTARGDTVNMFVDSLYDDVEFAASVVTACVDQTVYAIQCTSAPSSIGTKTCGPNGPVSFNFRPISGSLNKYLLHLDYNCNCGSRSL